MIEKEKSVYQKGVVLMPLYKRLHMCMPYQSSNDKQCIYKKEGAVKAHGRWMP